MKRLLKAVADLKRIIEECRNSNIFVVVNSQKEEDKILKQYENSFDLIKLIILRLW